MLINILEDACTGLTKEEKNYKVIDSTFAHKP